MGRNAALAAALAADGRHRYQLAAAASFSPSLLTDYVAGRRPLPRHHAEAIAAVLGVDAEQLLAAVPA